MAFYRALTINPNSNLVPSTQTNFPVLFQGEYSYLATTANGGKVQNANGYDIYFSSDTQGSNVLDFERVHWSAITGVCEFWVNVSSLGTSTTTIYLQYGNNSITTDQSNATATWDSNYVGVYHFGDGSSLNLNDSTGNTNNGTGVNTPTAVNDGIGSTGAGGGGAIGFTAANSQYVDLGNASSLALTTLTIEWWAKLTTGSSGEFTVCSNLITSPESGYYTALNTSGNDGYVYGYTTGTGTGALGRSIGLTAWHYYVGTYDGSHIKFYTDGSNDASVSLASIPAETNHCFVGAVNIGPTHYFNGDMDELRLSKVARSADWITTSYNMMSNQTTSGNIFISIGSEQVGATPINENLNDTLTLSDSVQEFMSLGFSPSDTQASNWGDAVSFNLQIPGIAFNENQATNWADTIILEMDFNGIFTDGFTLSDFQQPASSMDAFADAISLSDAFSTLVSIQIPLTDSFTWTDSTLVTTNVLITESDTFTFSDAVSFYIPLFVMFTDFFIWRDGQTVAWSSVLPPLSDTLTLSDSVSVNNVPFWTPVSRSLSDQLSLNDVILLQSLVALSLSDDFAFSDQTTVQDTYYPFNQLLIDSFTFNDSTLIIVEGDLLQFADTLVLSDSVLVANTTNFNNYIRRYLNDEPT